MRKILFILIAIFTFSITYSQDFIDQNGVKTSVTNSLGANGTQANRYEVARVGYNSHHWQRGGSMIIELFHDRFGTGYEKYHVGISYAEGTGSSAPTLELIESRGRFHNAKITLGNPQDLATSAGGYVNKVIPIYLDIKYYSYYKARLTYLRDKVNEVTTLSQISINTNPAAINIPDFDVSTDVTMPGKMSITGNVGIGTSDPQYKLSVKGTIGCGEIKVENVSGWADFVFEPEYKLMGLKELETYIQENKHLPEMPTTAEVEENGISIGEMNAKMVQKIEELTLYTLQQHERIESLVNRIETLENK